MDVEKAQLEIERLKRENDELRKQLGTSAPALVLNHTAYSPEFISQPELPREFSNVSPSKRK